MTPRVELIFQDQIDAAQRLIEILPSKEDIIANRYILICTSLDSVILADIVARELKIDYEILFCEAIMAPNNTECEIAMVSENEDIVINESLMNSFEITLDFIYGQAHRAYEEKILKKVYKYRKGKLIEDLKGKNVIMIDEGCETGLTALTCIKALINLGVRFIAYATPVIATDVAENLSTLIDEVFCVHKVKDFVEVDFYYQDKIEPKPEIILSILEESPYYLPLQKQGEKNAIFN